MRYDMSIEPTCDFCNVSVKPRCKSKEQAEKCSLYPVDKVFPAPRFTKNPEWEKYLTDPRGCKVIMDNDGWWFVNPELNEDGEHEWESGGDGPYGVDLLEYLLKRLGLRMECV